MESIKEEEVIKITNFLRDLRVNIIEWKDKTLFDLYNSPDFSQTTTTAIGYLASLCDYFLWPSWPDFDKAEKGTEKEKEYYKMLALREERVGKFFKTDGVNVLIQLLDATKNIPTFRILHLLKTMVIRTIQSLEYTLEEQKTMILNGTLQAIVPLINYSLSQNNKIPNNIMKTSLTIVWGMLEYKPVRSLAILDPNLNLVGSLETHLEFAGKTQRDCLGCLQLLTCELDCGDFFISNHWLEKLINIYTKQYHKLSHYYISLCIGNLLLYQEIHNIPSEHTINAREIIHHFLSSYTPEDIYKIESVDTFWNSIKPFSLLLVSHDPLLYTLAAFSLAHLTCRKMLRMLVESEGISELLQCVQWTMFEGAKGCGNMICSNIQSSSVPSLETLVLVKLRQLNLIPHEKLIKKFDL